MIKNHCVFNIKSESCYRSQLIAKEFSQVKGIDFDKLFSLAVNYEIAYLFLAIATLKNWDIYSCYNLKLNSGCNSDKDLSKNEEYDQLVKHKDTEMYLHYIYL